MDFENNMGGVVPSDEARRAIERDQQRLEEIKKKAQEFIAVAEGDLKEALADVARRGRDLQEVAEYIMVQANKDKAKSPAKSTGNSNEVIAAAADDSIDPDVSTAEKALDELSRQRGETMH